MMKESPITKFFSDQLSVWPLAANNFRALKNARIRELEVNGFKVKVQCNPERIKSSLAGEAESWQEPGGCFLCREHRPAEQFHLDFDGRKGRRYHIQVNPYPIFPCHLVIARDKHVDQSIWHRYVDMLDLARKFSDFTFFYNGPMCGASKPDHMHFQACPKGLLPLVEEVDSAMRTASGTLEYLTNVQEARLFHFRSYARGVFALRATTSKSMAKLFYRLLDCAPMREGEKEPRFNVFTWFESGEYRSLVVLRDELRSRHFYAEGEEHFTMSIGCADMAGFFIVPVVAEFERISAGVLSEIVDAVTVSEEAEAQVIWRLTRTQSLIEVGIMSADEILFEIISDGAGLQKVTFDGGRINYNGALYDELYFDAVTPSSLFAEPSFILYGVTIGVDFHWERKQAQKFAGSLKFIAENGKVTAINRIGVEDYLLSVISSEMNGAASVGFLKAHAVISRSWVMSLMQRRRDGQANAADVRGESGDGVMIRWFDHDDHRLFDVCADDHCQRYQGLGGSVSANARKAVDETWGEVLTYDGQICDARFSKCCGGVTEKFSTCWEDKDLPYLVSAPDASEEGGDPFCHTSDKQILAQVLNGYDLETEDFYRWTARYGRTELSELFRRRSGLDVGEIERLVPVERGGSGRICRLRVEGSVNTVTIGKELLIRRFLSPSHLKSSAFEVEYDGDDIVLHGKGWGHGVGLCQIGAAVMSVRGYDYKQILEHYYPGSRLERR